MWLGLAAGDELVGAIAAEVATRLLPLGFTPEDRPFHAHLTLARLKPPRSVADALGVLASDPVGDPWPVDEVVVYESRLRRTGAEYVARARLPLALDGP